MNILKKKILSIILVSMLFGGIVSAASLWGTYKGNEIIKVQYSGVNVTPKDVPAISFDGRTMIPINLLGQIGVQYTWDQKNQTVNIIGNKSNSNDVKLKVAQNNIQMANYYKNLDDLGETISIIINGYSLAFQDISNQYNNNMLSQADEKLDIVINNYNSIQKQLQPFPEYNQILNHYYDSIEFIKKSSRNLSSYSLSNSNTDFQNYQKNTSYASESMRKARLGAMTGYNKYLKSALEVK